MHVSQVCWELIQIYISLDFFIGIVINIFPLQSWTITLYQCWFVAYFWQSIGVAPGRLQVYWELTSWRRCLCWLVGLLNLWYLWYSGSGWCLLTMLMAELGFSLRGASTALIRCTNCPKISCLGIHANLSLFVLAWL